MVFYFPQSQLPSGHPDKLCDAISDAIVDACLAIDSNARVAVETCVKGKEDKGLIVLAGEVSLNGEVPNYAAIARAAGANIGYVSHKIGMDATSEELCDMCRFTSPHSQQILLKALTKTALTKEQATKG